MERKCYGAAAVFAVISLHITFSVRMAMLMTICVILLPLFLMHTDEPYYRVRFSSDKEWRGYIRKKGTEHCAFLAFVPSFSAVFSLLETMQPYHFILIYCACFLHLLFYMFLIVRCGDSSEMPMYVFLTEMALCLALTRLRVLGCIYNAYAVCMPHYLVGHCLFYVIACLPVLRKQGDRS